LNRSLIASEVKLETLKMSDDASYSEIGIDLHLIFEDDERDCVFENVPRFQRYHRKRVLIGCICVLESSRS